MDRVGHFFILGLNSVTTLFLFGLFSENHTKVYILTVVTNHNHGLHCFFCLDQHRRFFFPFCFFDSFLSACRVF